MTVKVQENAIIAISCGCGCWTTVEARKTPHDSSLWRSLISSWSFAVLTVVMSPFLMNFMLSVKEPYPNHV